MKADSWKDPPTNDETRRPKLPPALTWEELTAPVDESENLLGNRLLERGSALLLFGPAGCGKSVALVQAHVYWSCGLPGLHIPPAHPLKILMLQTEDSTNDVREMMDGILRSTLFTPERLALVRKNLVFLPRLPGGTPQHLVDLATAGITAHKPELICANPLLAWCDRDPTRDLGTLLYQSIDPILKARGVGFTGGHHTPKTNRMDTSAYGAHDWQYMAAGDARVANWPRAMIQIEPTAIAGLYRFRCPKRWTRTGWTWDQKPVSERYFRWAANGLSWEDASPEETQQAEQAEDRLRILEILPDADQPGISRERVRDLARKKLAVGANKADGWLKLAVEDGKAIRHRDGHVVTFTKAQVSCFDP